MKLFSPLYYTIITAATLLFSCGNNPVQIQKKENTHKVPAIDFSRSFSPRTDSVISKYWNWMHQRLAYCGVTFLAQNDSFYIWSAGEADSGIKLNADLPMQTASISKTFCATACMIFIENGKLALTDTLGKFFPDFPYYHITIEQLLSHASGLPEYTWFADHHQKEYQRRIENKDVLEMLYKHKPESYFAPGKRHRYCNTNFIILTQIIEKISGKKYHAFLQENIFDPLDMKHTRVLSPQFKFSDLEVKGHYGDGRILGEDYQDGTFGDKNIISTVYDLYRFYNGLQRNLLISEKSKMEMFRTRWIHARGNTDYALGWRKREINGETWMYHSGWWHGFRTNFYFSLKADKCAVTLSNRLSGGFIPGVVIAGMFNPEIFKNIFHHQKPTDLRTQQEE